VNIFRRTARSTSPRLSDTQLRIAWQAVSLLLDYPGEQAARHRALIRAELGSLPDPVASGLRTFLDFADVAEASEPGRLEREYVETFDHTRRGCLYLTYFAYGDTRRRGVVLVQFKQAYRKAGGEFDADELPDHLAVVLEFGATHDPATAWKLLADYRAGVEMLRISLQDRQSPWADVLVALCATLPSLGEDEAGEVARLIEQGPPVEEVGTEGYALDPSLSAPYEPASADPAGHFLGGTIPVGAPVGAER
jgi:nitrate reductase delta subunit